MVYTQEGKVVYTHKELFELGPQKTYSEADTEAAFLLGGIGTGNVSLGSRGELRDWEIFNYPGKGNLMPNTHFAIWAKKEGEAPVAKILQSEISPPHSHSHGYHPDSAAGLPRLKKSTLRGEYPVARIDFEDDDLPVHVSLEAFTPFIPLNEKDSGIPGAYLTYRLTNTSDRTVETTVVGSVFNVVGGLKLDKFNRLDYSQLGQNKNEYINNQHLSGLLLTSDKYESSQLQYGNMSLVTTNPNVTYKRAWLRGAWFDYLQEFWDDLVEDGRLNDLNYNSPNPDKYSDTGSLGVCETIAPGETKEVRFMLTWYFPNRFRGWEDHHAGTMDDKKLEKNGIVQNFYVNMFDSSWSAAEYMVQQQERLTRETFLFRQSLFSSTLPAYVIDALASNITVLRSTTCFWLQDGRFFGYEGTFDHYGCCFGTCTHVWNYAQTLAFLFPTLEQSMRRTEFLGEMHEDGRMNMRAQNAFNQDWVFHYGQAVPAAADGQMGAIMRVYREWKLTGDDAFIRQLWPSVKKSLSFASSYWDKDGDYVLDGVQHNTYDIDFHGPNPLTGICFLGALKAAVEMASYLNETEMAQTYEEMFTKGSERLDQMLWNGEYYIQCLENVNDYKYQHGLGCLSDQLLAQQFAHVYGLGYLLPQEKVKSAVKAVYNYNFRTDFSNHKNCQRVYALNDEKGLLLCSWPQGGRPRLPFVYSDEVWTGVEYQVAAHLIFEGYIEEGLTIAKAVRDRHDGQRRNPWNEVECGHHYARSMSSWGLLIALSGFKFDMVRKEIAFAPVIEQESFTTFWSTGLAWGTYSQNKNRETGDFEVDIQVLQGDATGIKVFACGKEWFL